MTGFSARERSESRLATAWIIVSAAACIAGAMALVAIQPAPIKPQRVLFTEEVKVS